MLKGFKDFLMRGNVIDLAVAVVIGAAFGAVVKAFTDNIVSPIVAAAGGGDPDSLGFGFHIRSGVDSTFVNVGFVITALLNFVIVAAVVYFVFVMPMNKINERRAARVVNEPEPEAVPIDVQLLTEIRDLLARGEGTSLGGPRH